jgi:hypothetical protein
VITVLARTTSASAGVLVVFAVVQLAVSGDIDRVCSPLGVVALLGLLAVARPGDVRLRAIAFARAGSAVVLGDLALAAAVPGRLLAVVLLVVGASVFARTMPVSEGSRAPVLPLRSPR